MLRGKFVFFVPVPCSGKEWNPTSREPLSGSSISLPPSFASPSTPSPLSPRPYHVKLRTLASHPNISRPQTQAFDFLVVPEMSLQATPLWIWVVGLVVYPVVLVVLGELVRRHDRLKFRKQQQRLTLEFETLLGQTSPK